MSDFPASVRQPTDFTTMIVNVTLLALLAVMFWFAIRKPRPNAAGKFRVWFVLSTGIVFDQLVGIASFPSHALAALSSGVAAIIVCMIRSSMHRDLCHSLTQIV